MITLKSIKQIWVLPGLIFAPVLFAEMPELPRGKGEYCVEPTDVMRKNHMSFLLHQRDETVLSGIRTKKHSLVGCVDCHVQTNAKGGFIPVDAPAQFCEVCHSFASVKLDCFECHATTPDEANSAMRSTKGKSLAGASKLEQEIRRFIAHSRSGISTGKN